MPAVPQTRPNISVALVRRLIAAQFPRWAHLPVTPVAHGGNDNRTFHLGPEMSVRLPSAQGYAAQVLKEHRWLPRLAPHLPLPIPQPLALGRPAPDYPWPWSVYRWIDGAVTGSALIADMSQFGTDISQFLTSLQAIDAAGGPAAGAHSFYRGAPPAVYDAQTREAIATLGDRIDAAATTAVWDAALAAEWHGPPVWVHGDVAVGNLLVTGGRLSAVIDFGCLAVGDPACDLVIAWTLFSGASRAAFRAGLPLDAGTWARGRGWALWKALITLADVVDTDPAIAAESRRVIAAVVADHEAATE